MISLTLSCSRHISASLVQWPPDIALVAVVILFACCTYYTGESFCEAQTEGDSNGTRKHSYDDKPRLYLCTICNRRFTTKYCLQVHKLRHTGEKKYSCNHCEKRFYDQYSLNSHMSVHSSKYKCTECGKSFQSNRDLSIHRRKHRRETIQMWHVWQCI